MTGKTEAFEKDVCFLRNTFRVCIHQQAAQDTILVVNEKQVLLGSEQL